MTLPRMSGKSFSINTPRFEILNGSLIDFIALHSLVYRKQVKTALRWVPKNISGMVKNLTWISTEEYNELETKVNEMIAYYEVRSRNYYKREYRRLLQRLEAK